MADIEQMKKIVPLITCEISFCQHFCKLVSGVNVTDLNFGIHINLVKQPIQSDSVGPWNMSHCGTSIFDNRFDYHLIVLTGTRIRCIWWNVINVCWNDVGVLHWDGVYACLTWQLLTGFPEALSWVLLFCSVRNAGIPSMRKLASREMISASVELCETEICFLRIQLIGTNVWLPKKHKTPPDVDFGSSRSLAKSESWNNPNLHCFPHNHIACIDMCDDECTRSNALSVCHKILSILWPHEQACSQTTKHQVSQYEPNTNISEQFLNRLWQFSYCLNFFLFELMVIHAWRCDFV